MQNILVASKALAVYLFALPKEYYTAQRWHYIESRRIVQRVAIPLTVIYYLTDSNFGTALLRGLAP